MLTLFSLTNVAKVVRGSSREELMSCKVNLNWVPKEKKDLPGIGVNLVPLHQMVLQNACRNINFNEINCNKFKVILCTRQWWAVVNY